MSDFDRNAAAAQYGRPLTRAEAAVVDEGLRAYMLRIYNYMVLGLAITGFAAIGIYMLSVTTDPTAAYQAARPLARGMYLTQVGFYLFASPLKWVVILAPLALVFFLSYRIENMSTTSGCSAATRVSASAASAAWPTTCVPSMPAK